MKCLKIRIKLYLYVSFHMTDSHANNIYSIPYYSAAVLTPVFGGLIDKFG